MPQHASQDLDARFSVFLNPIRDLTKNWEVDIAKYLEDYLVELSEIQITFDGGVTVMNFAEAAMLIQGSATVYSKKVEFLWQMVLQMLDLLSSKRSLDLDADDGPKIGGGRASKHSQTLLFEKMNDVTTGKHIDLKLEDEEEDKKIDFKYLPAMPLHLVEKEGEKSGMRIPLYLKNNESFGNKEDYRINRSYLTSAGLLCLDLPHELLQQNVGIHYPGVPGGLNDSVAGFFAPEGVDIQAEAAALSSPKEDEAPDADMLDDGVDHGGGFDEMDHESEREPSLNDLPVNPPLDPLFDLLLEGAAQGAGPDPAPREKNVIEKETTQIVDVVNGRCGLRKRGAKEKEKIAEVKLTDPLKPMDPHVETPAKRPIRAGRIRKPLPCNCHKEPVKRNSRARKNALKDNDNLLNSKIISVEKFITKDLVNFIANNNNIDAKNSLIDPRVLQEFATEQAKKQEKMKKERVKEVVKKGVPEDEAKERVDEEDELMKTVMEERCEDDVFDNDVPNLDFDHIENGEEEFLLPDPHNDIVTPFGIIRSDEGGTSDHPDSGGRGGLNDSIQYEPASDYEALVQKWVSDYVANAQEHIASSDITKRVNKWKKRIGPKLIEEEERKAFDIHEYGSYVLSHFPSDDVGGHVLFSEVGQNEDRREVSRIFLSCLMLANTYNIELSNTREGDLEMDCLQLKLLSRVRHHQELDEYAAAAQHARPSSPTRVRRPISPPYSKKKKNKRKVQTSSDDSDDSFCPTEQVGDVVPKNQKCSSKTRKSKKQKALRENS